VRVEGRIAYMTFLKTDPNFSYIMLSMAADFYLVLYGYHAIAITY